MNFKEWFVDIKYEIMKRCLTGIDSVVRAIEFN